MNTPNGISGESKRLAFYITHPHPCGYLPGEEAVSLLADPTFPVDPTIYEQLLEMGFRRSGEQVYRPHCSTCHGCVAVRVPIESFAMNRSLNRVWRRNQDLQIIPTSASFREEHFALYKKYLRTRHRGGAMDHPTPASYQDFLISPWLDTEFLEFRQNDRLLMVAVIDLLPSALSAVYTFFDPDETTRSLGTFAVLSEIELARKWHMNHLYLGYWIAACQKMRYKARFQPLEALQGDRWELLDLAR